MNECLSSAHPQLNDLTQILTRFRLGKYAITTDIEKAFLHFPAFRSSYLFLADLERRLFPFLDDERDLSRLAAFFGDLERAPQNSVESGIKHHNPSPANYDSYYLIQNINVDELM